MVRQHSAIRHGHECPDVRCAAFSEVLFDVFSRRYKNGATIVASNLPFQEWTSVFASERLTGALLDRITHHVYIPEMNGESHGLKQSRSRRRPPSE